MRTLKNLSKRPIIGPVARHALGHVVNFEANRISKHFLKYMRPTIARCDNERDVAFNIRHQVYCEELAFEEVRAQQKERDAFDIYSTHCVMQHVASDAAMGTVRVVLPKGEAQLLPMEAHCSDFITDMSKHPKNFRRDQICEISRLAIPKSFRRRSSDKFDGAATGGIDVSQYSQTELRCFPFVAIGLYFSAASVVAHNNADYCYAMMEPKLAQSMRFVGIDFRQIGPAMEYRGLRAPYYIPCAQFYDGMKPGLRRLCSVISQKLEHF
ncbi:MAG: PEP-CTERM/exosortase system-associated acyltransferase [Alphaproteobacteria bacterium]